MKNKKELEISEKRRHLVSTEKVNVEEFQKGRRV